MSRMYLADDEVTYLVRIERSMRGTIARHGGASSERGVEKPGCPELRSDSVATVIGHPRMDGIILQFILRAHNGSAQVMISYRDQAG